MYKNIIIGIYSEKLSWGRGKIQILNNVGERNVYNSCKCSLVADPTTSLHFHVTSLSQDGSEKAGCMKFWQGVQPPPIPRNSSCGYTVEPA